MKYLLAILVIAVGVSGVPVDSPKTKCTGNEKIGVPGECRTYLECKNGVLQPNFCWWPRKFDIVEHKCVWHGAKCQPSEPTTSTKPDGPTKPGTTPTSTKPTPSTPSTPQPTVTTPKGGCTPGARLPVKKDCTKFLECRGADMVQESCAMFQKFDSISLTCVYVGAKCA